MTTDMTGETPYQHGYRVARVWYRGLTPAGARRAARAEARFARGARALRGYRAFQLGVARGQDGGAR